MRTLTGARAGLLVAPIVLVAAPAAANADLPVGEAEGVRIVRERGALVVVFTQRAERLRKRVAGKLVSVLCTELVASGANSGGATQRAPNGGRRIKTGDLTRGMDYCRVWLAARTVKRDGERRRVGRELIVSIPLTQNGAVILDEESKTAGMIGLLTVAGFYAAEGEAGRLPHAAAAARGDRGGARTGAAQARRPGAAHDTPPLGKTGYYSDGREHVAAVVVSASGRRLFIETAADNVLHTNVAENRFGDVY